MKNRKGKKWAYVLLALSAVVVAAVLLPVMQPRLWQQLKVRAGWEKPVPTLHVDVPRKEFPVKGIDVSHHNGKIDFRKVAADSVDFVIIKATEGVDFRDPRLESYYRDATDAGLLVGFYHFFRFDRGGVRQGKNFLGAVEGMPTQFPLVIDFESSGNGTADYYRIVGRLRDICDYLRRQGRRIMIYCNHTDYEQYIRGNFDGVDLWLASGRIPAGDDRRSLWQHSHNGRVRGIDHPVDINTFNGSRAEFEQWIAQ